MLLKMTGLDTPALEFYDAFEISRVTSPADRQTFTLFFLEVVVSPIVRISITARAYVVTATRVATQHPK